jgi:hypothetical protein
MSLVSKLTDNGVPWGALQGILAPLGKVTALQKASIYMPSGLQAREDSVSLWLEENEHAWNMEMIMHVTMSQCS